MMSERKIIMIICLFEFFFSIGFISFGIYVANIHSINVIALALLIFGACLSLFSIIGFFGSKNESNYLLLWYLYSRIPFVLFTILFSISSLFLQDYFNLWLKHHQEDPVITYLSHHSCCLTYEKTKEFLRQLLLIFGISSIISIFILFISMYNTAKLLTIPILMRNMLVIMNTIFIPIGGGILSFGTYLLHHLPMIAGKLWIAILVITIGSIILCFALLGVIGTKSKNRTFLLIYQIGLGLSLFGFIIMAIFCFIHSNTLSNHFLFNENINYSDIACLTSLYGCSNCTNNPFKTCHGVYKNNSNSWLECMKVETFVPELNNKNHTFIYEINPTCQSGYTIIYPSLKENYYMNNIVECKKCPEWSNSDIDLYIQNSINFLGLIAILIGFFIIIIIFGAIILRRSLKGYQTDVV